MQRHSCSNEQQTKTRVRCRDGLSSHFSVLTSEEGETAAKEERESSVVECNGEAESKELAKSLKHEIIEDGANEVLKAKHSSLTTLPSGLWRRHSFRLKRQGSSAKDDKDKGSDSPVISEITDVSKPTEKTNKIVQVFKDHEKVSEISDSSRFHSSSGPITNVQEEDTEDSTITFANNECVARDGGFPCCKPR
ncbi:hypothetical protein NE237_006005 [Protea cynaroides]|uniref:Uncharacterized protein n=1 Tax=Protea cynaroides TaxID=273540 RepID=A0A9Q0KMC6_9MAGN|nr:hypothetical protein NE237_006005 [Protea cynaroides]